MSKTDLAAWPIYHHTRESTEAHLSIVFAALAVSRWIDNTTGWSTKRFVTTTRRYRTIEIQASHHAITAADPLPDDLQAALNAIHGAHSYAGSSAGRDQSALVRQHHGLDSVTELQLGQDPPNVGLHGRLRDVHAGGDFGVGQALGDQQQHLAFPLGKLGEPRVLGRAGTELAGELVEQPPGDRRGHHRVALGDHPDRGQQLLRRHVLQQETAGPARSASRTHTACG